MTKTAHDLPLALDGHTARVHVREDQDGGWDVRTELDGRQIASDYCSDWRSVERFHMRMQHWLKTAAMQARLSSAA
jgi:hypothetical protein